MMTSQSRSETSRINVRFTLTRDPDSAAADVRDKVSRVRAASCPTPSTSRSSPRSRPTRSPIIYIAVAGGLADAARGLRLRQALRQAAAVGAAGRGRRAHLRRAAGVDAHQPRPHAARRLQADGAGRRGRDPPAERRDSRPAASSRRRASSPSSPRPTCSTPEQFNNIIVANVGGYPVRIRDVGTAADRRASTSASISRFNGKPSLNIGVIKQAVANPLELSQGGARRGRQDQREPAAGHEARRRLRHVGVHRPLDQVGVPDHRRGDRCWSCW